MTALLVLALLLLGCVAKELEPVDSLAGEGISMYPKCENPFECLEDEK